MGSCSMYRSAGELRVLSDGEEDRAASPSSEEEFADDEYSVRVEVYETEVTGSCSSGSSPIIKISGLHTSGGVVRLCSSTHYLSGNSKPPCIQPLPPGRLIYASNKSLPILHSRSSKRRTAMHTRVSSPVIAHHVDYDSHSALAHSKDPVDTRPNPRNDGPTCSVISVREQTSQSSQRTFVVHPCKGSAKKLERAAPIGSTKKPEATSTFRSKVSECESGDKHRPDEGSKRSTEIEENLEQSHRKTAGGGRKFRGGVCNHTCCRKHRCRRNVHKACDMSTFHCECSNPTSLLHEACDIPPAARCRCSLQYSASGVNFIRETVTTRVMPADLLQSTMTEGGCMCCRARNRMRARHFPTEITTIRRPLPHNNGKLRSQRHAGHSCCGCVGEDPTLNRDFGTFCSFDATASGVQTTEEDRAPHRIERSDRETQTSSTGNPLPHVLTSLIEWFAVTCQNFVSRFSHLPGVKPSTQPVGKPVPLHVTLGKSLQDLLAHDVSVWWSLVKQIHDGITGFTDRDTSYISTTARRSTKARDTNAVIMTANVLGVPQNAGLFEKRKGMRGEGECVTLFKRQDRKRRQRCRKELPKRTSSELDLRELCAAELMSVMCIPQMGNRIEHRWSCTKF